MNIFSILQLNDQIISRGTVQNLYLSSKDLYKIFNYLHLKFTAKSCMLKIMQKFNLFTLPNLFYFILSYNL